MYFLTKLPEIFLHLDKYLDILIRDFGVFSYFILFFVIFMETGFVVTPFLPGDSILFASGAFAALGSFNIITLFITLFIAAVLGDTANYWIGYRLGPKFFKRNTKLIKKEYLERTKHFYEKHGGKTIVLARFVPIVRTFAPFVAGIGIMSYPKFLSFNIIGGFLWTALFIFTGYYFGNISFVKNNFEIVVLAIVFVSLIPMILEFIKSRTKKKVLPESLN
jgi:membrane-associated protein